jgi:tetratricopeptide (TPR) repeat protein
VNGQEETLRTLPERMGAVKRRRRRLAPATGSGAESSRFKALLERSSFPAEPVERVLPAALLHLWTEKDPTVTARMKGLAERASGVVPAGPGRWLVLPLPGDAAIFDRAVALGGALLADIGSGTPPPSLLVTPAAAAVGERVTLLAETLLDELAQARPAIEPGKVLLTTHAAHHLEGSWAVEASGNLSFGGGRLIPLAAVHPRAVAIPSWRNPEVLSRSVKWVPRPEVEEELSERLALPIVRLTGAFGVGKTRLTWEVMRAAGEPAIWRNAALFRLQPGAMSSLVAELEAEPARPIWIVYDHLEAALPQIWAEIEEIQKHPRLGSEIRLVLLGRPAIDWPEALRATPLVRLGALDGEAWSRCTAQLFRGLSLPEPVAATLAAGAGGNPFALEEALHFLVRDRRLRQVFGSFFFSGADGAEAHFQPSRRYLAHAEAEAMRLGTALPLRLLAQIDDPAPATELRSAALALGCNGLSPQWEDPFRAAGLVVDSEGPWGEGLAFASPALRAAFSDTLRGEAAALLRAGLGELLAARSSSTDELWAAYVLLRGSEAGARTLLAAAATPAKIPREQLFTALRFELAALRDRAGDPELEIDLLWVLLPLARRMGRLHELAPALERGFDLARENPPRFLALAALRAELAQMAGRYAEAEWVLRQALAGHKGGDARRKEMLLLELGRVLVRQGKTTEAGELFAKTLEVAEHRGRKGLAATCRYFLGNIAYHEFRLDEARALHLQALEVRREKGTGVATSLSALGAVALAQGNFPGGLAYFEEARALLAAEKSDAEEAYALVGVGKAMTRLGDFAGAAPVLRRALALREGRDDTVGEAISRLAVAENHLYLDQPDLALVEARKAHFALSLAPPGEARADAEQLLGRIQLRLRRNEAALSNLEEAARIHRELGKGSSLLADLAYRVEAEIARGRPEAVLGALERLAAERPQFDNAPLRELSDFHLYLAAEWLAGRGGGTTDVKGPLERSYAELMRQTGFLAPAMRQRFLFQVPLHRAIMEAATRHGLSMPAR